MIQTISWQSFAVLISSFAEGFRGRCAGHQRPRSCNAPQRWRRQTRCPACELPPGFLSESETQSYPSSGGALSPPDWGDAGQSGAGESLVAACASALAALSAALAFFAPAPALHLQTLGQNQATWNAVGAWWQNSEPLHPLQSQVRTWRPLEQKHSLSLGSAPSSGRLLNPQSMGRWRLEEQLSPSDQSHSVAQVSPAEVVQLPTGKRNWKEKEKEMKVVRKRRKVIERNERSKGNKPWGCWAALVSSRVIKGTSCGFARVESWAEKQGMMTKKWRMEKKKLLWVELNF